MLLHLQLPLPLDANRLPRRHLAPPLLKPPLPPAHPVQKPPRRARLLHLHIQQRAAVRHIRHLAIRIRRLLNRQHRRVRAVQHGLLGLGLGRRQALRLRLRGVHRHRRRRRVERLVPPVHDVLWERDGVAAAGQRVEVRHAVLAVSLLRLRADRLAQQPVLGDPARLLGAAARAREGGEDAAGGALGGARGEDGREGVRGDGFGEGRGDGDGAVEGEEGGCCDLCGTGRVSTALQASAGRAGGWSGWLVTHL